MSLFYRVDDTLSPEHLARLDPFFENALVASTQRGSLHTTSPKKHPFGCWILAFMADEQPNLYVMSQRPCTIRRDTSTTFLDRAQNILKDMPNIDVTSPY